MAMLDFRERITDYISKNFTTSEPNLANFRRSPAELLGYLFEAFPRGCISDYELVEIMEELDYELHTWVEESTHITGEGEEEVTVVTRSLVTGWCMMSEFDLSTHEYLTGR